MRYFSFITLITLFTTYTYGQSQEMHRNDDVANIIIDFDASCMQKFDYHTDYEYIVEENYSNYHLRLNENQTFIVKVNSSTPASTLAKEGITKYFGLTCENADQIIDRWFIFRLNYGGSNVYIKLGDKIYKAAYTIFKEMDDRHMSYYAPPYASFKYEYNTEHYPAQSIPTEQEENHDLFYVTYLLHGKTQEKGIRKDVFLKIYNETCHGRDFGITTPLSPVGENNPLLVEENRPVTNQQSKMVYRSCQHPIQSEYIKDIGLFKESYKEIDKTYTSQLVAIDNVPINQYLQLVSSSLQEEKPQEEKITEPLPNEYYFAVRGEGNNTNDIVLRDSPIQPINRNKTSEPVPFLKKKTRQQPASSLHHVQSGDTLYNLSKKYDTTVQELKELNNLTDSTIQLGQELKVPK